MGQLDHCLSALVGLPDDRQVSGASTGSGRSNTVLTALKIARLAPMASAKVTMAVAAYPGDCHK
jgi:hypothetical protein